jgi:hypothetical protein
MSAECGLRIAESRLRSADCELRSVDGAKARTVFLPLLGLRAKPRQRTHLTAGVRAVWKTRLRKERTHG